MEMDFDFFGTTAHREGAAADTVVIAELTDPVSPSSSSRHIPTELQLPPSLKLGTGALSTPYKTSRPLELLGTSPSSGYETSDYNDSLASLALPKKQGASSNHTVNVRPLQKSSAYWRVPDAANYLTCVATQDEGPLCAVGSGATANNLFIYEALSGNAGLTHHQTISMSGIHALEWMPRQSVLGRLGNVLISGHSHGVVHMTLLPAASDSGVSAEILKRYSHAKHLPRSGSTTGTRISEITLTPAKWSCVPESSIMTLCAEHLFMWEPGCSELPVVKQRVKGSQSLAANKLREGVLAVGGRRGVSIRDIRVHGAGAGSGLSPPGSDHDGSVTKVCWSPNNDCWLASVHAATNVVKVWDIRQTSPMATYRAHTDTVTGLEWLPESESELVTSSADGTVRVWDAKKHPAPETGMAGLPNGHSAWDKYRRRSLFDRELDELAMDLLDVSGTELHEKGDLREFRAMALSNHGAECMTVDVSGCLGVHRLGNDEDLSLSPITTTEFSDDGIDFSI